MKKINWICSAAMLLAIGITLFAGAGCRESATAPAANYTCPMHPDVVKDRPGKCPQCGMALTPLKPTASATAEGCAMALGCCGR